ncbi:DMT family transporter [Plantactinospora soyae]|uniref:Drug/metabolite transporter (DMT)-like permease n=1 Tax=Plantactinospora soyae TaxID=1544732 RepID=A0A927RA14_9ACTN|nr:DMT family transporter [Plantactinospora soyae]MBE1491954.1 drug/metabolite transporter (DMT)-like permease [Plantactinospora soyae]
MTIAAVLLALASASCFALGAALQQRAVRREPPHGTADLRLFLRMLRRKRWLLAKLPDFTGTALQALALRFGPLTLVQPLLISGMFLAIPLEAALDHRRPHPRDVTAVASCVFGLGAFLAAAQPRAGVSEPSLMGWLGVALIGGSLIGVCLVLAHRARGALRGTLLGIATGLLYAGTASVLKTFAERVFSDPLSTLTDWHLYALAVIGVAAVALNQNAFQNGPLAAPLTAITLVDPVSSVLIGVTAFHETLSFGGLRLLVEVPAVLAMIFGIWLASTRPSGREGFEGAPNT